MHEDDDDRDDESTAGKSRDYDAGDGSCTQIIRLGRTWRSTISLCLHDIA